MIYSQSTLQSAFSAPTKLNLFREMITIEDVLESNIDEYEKMMYEESLPTYEEQKRDWMTAHQGDNQELTEEL